MLYYNCSKEQNRPQQSRKIFEKTFQKTLDNNPKICYTNNVPRGTQKTKPHKGRKRYLMNMESLFTSLTEMFPNGILSRTKTHGNFIAVEGEVVDGVQTYYAVKPIALLAKSNDRYEAFNLENAHAEYLEFVANQEAKANKPKKTKGVDPVKVAAKEKRMNDLLEYLKSHANVAYTASELFTAIPQYNLDGLSNMAVGSDLVALMHTDENLSYETDTAKKKHWTYNM